jgi:integrase/recombinase XerC
MKEQIVENNPAVNLPIPKIRKKLPNFVEEKNLNHLLDDGFLLMILKEFAIN